MNEQTPMTERTLEASRFNSSAASPRPAWFRQLIREPLLQFLVAGGLLFAAHGYVGSKRGDASNASKIIVPAGKVEHLAALFSRTWQRPPTKEELRGLVDDYVREEAAYREGLAIGLDRDDTIIRRRVRQKLDFVAQDVASQLEPTDEELAEYLSTHQANFRVGSRLTLRQVYFDPSKHGDDLESIVSDLAVALREDSSLDPMEQGDRTLLDFRLDGVSEREISSLFGEQFATEVAGIEPGKWTAPIKSAYGVHAVIVDHLQAGRTPQLDEIRETVLRDWTQDRRQELTEKYYEGLIKKYAIVIDWPSLVAEE